MQDYQNWLTLRDDTFLGICQGVGEDLGFSPNWLRLAFAAPLLWYPAYVVGAYAALGVIVLASRLLAPVPSVRRQSTPDKAAAAPPVQANGSDPAVDEMLLAA